MAAGFYLRPRSCSCSAAAAAAVATLQLSQCIQLATTTLWRPRYQVWRCSSTGKASVAACGHVFGIIGVGHQLYMSHRCDSWSGHKTGDSLLTGRADSACGQPGLSVWFTHTSPHLVLQPHKSPLPLNASAQHGYALQTHLMSCFNSGRCSECNTVLTHRQPEVTPRGDHGGLLCRLQTNLIIPRGCSMHQVDWPIVQRTFCVGPAAPCLRCFDGPLIRPNTGTSIPRAPAGVDLCYVQPAKHAPVQEALEECLQAYHTL